MSKKALNESDFHCGGTLINRNYVLTAAHCIKNKKTMKEGWKLSNVVFGVWSLEWTQADYRDTEIPEPVSIPISKKIIHENYQIDSVNKKDDIALLRLKYSVEFTVFINPLCLPDTTVVNQNFINAQDSLESSGFGITENSESITTRKKVVRAEIIPNNDCQIVNNTALTSKQLCATIHLEGDLCWGRFTHLSLSKLRHFDMFSSFVYS